ncbi:MAG: peptidylprolyl isomerase [Actinomycetota bacterium]
MANDKRERQRQARTARIEQERQDQDRARRNRMAFTIGGAVVLVIAVVVLAGLLSSDDGDDETLIVETADATDETTETTDETPETTAPVPVCPPEQGVDEPVLVFDEAPPNCIDLETTYRATMVTNQGDIVLELDPALDPVSVNNFIVLARYRYYDGVTFHRVIEDFVIQGGDPVGDPPGTGGPGYQFTGGTPADGYEIGDIAMANRGDPTSNGAQFFIITGPNGASLPPLYSPLGSVVEGLDIALEIQSVETEGADQPVEDVVIESIIVEPVG